MKPRLIAFSLTALVMACAFAASFAHAEPPRTWPNEHRLFAPCPVTPWARPQAKGVSQA